jgi:hypothetical protein
MPFDWVSARYACSLPSIFQILGEVLQADADIANKLPGLNRSFEVTLHPKRIIVSRVSGANPTNVVFELFRADIAVREGPNQAMFRARPSLNQDGECMLEVDGQPLKLWQVCRKALDDLFFGE